MGIAPSPSDPAFAAPVSPARRDADMRALQDALGGRYVLERELGRGGMGIVYLAWDGTLERRVALKVLPRSAGTPRRRARFLTEARIAARLRHDHIVPIHAVDDAGPFVYYTMDYVSGETLAERILAQGALPVDEVTRILHDVARAVAYAHERGVVHRDLKPQNILLEEGTGRAWVADFGLARVVHDGVLPNADAGRTVGTVAYVSPEQAAGLPADRRSDVYSLGVVGWVMATGEPLFAGSMREILAQHVLRPAPPLGVLGRHDDTTLERAVGRCLRKDPAERFQTAGELARALARAPEIRSDLPAPLGDFVARLGLQSRSAAVGVVLGAAGLYVLAWGLGTGHGGWAAGAAGFLALLAASPVAAALPAMRRLLREGYGRADVVHALHVDLDRQRERLASRWGRATDAAATAVRRVAAGAAGLLGLGTLAAVSGWDVPTGLVMGGIIVGTFGTLGAGGVLVLRERRRNELAGRRWLRFWQSRLGAWTARLAALGLPRAAEPTPTEPEADRLPLPSGAYASPLGPLDQLDDIAGRAESYVRRIRAVLAVSSATREREGRAAAPEEDQTEATLERQAEALEALLARFLAVDAITGVPGTLTADLEAAREICEMVEGLIEGKEWRAG